MAVSRVWIAGYFKAPPAAIGAAPVWIAPNDGTVPSAAKAVIAGYFAKVAGATPVWIAGYFRSPPASIGATPITISGWGGSGGGGGGTTSVWSAADAAASGSNLTLSNGGLTVANTVDSVTRSIRTTISKTSGKVYVEFKCNSIDAATYGLWGLASSDLDLANYLGGSNYSVGIYNGGTTFASAGFTSNYGTAIAPAPNDVFALAVDFAAGSIWIAKNNVWVNSSNPATGSLPIASFVPATVGPLFAGQSFRFVGNSWTLQSTAASQKYAPPSGFSAWDGGVAPPPTSVWSASDAAAADVPMTLANGGLDVTYSGAANWQSIRTSISKTSGKLYVEFKVSTTTTGAVVFGLGSGSIVLAAPLGNTPYSAGVLSPFSQVLVSAGFTSNYLPTGLTPALGDVWALAVDFAAGTIWIAQNNVWFSSSNPATGSLPIISFVPATVGALFAGMSFHLSGQGTWTLQATAASQKYAPPSGFKAWDAP